MKIYITGNYHHKNKFFLDMFIKKNINYILVSGIDDADIIFSADRYISIEKYPNKKFIFGPHFSVFPNDIVRKFNNIYNNAIYIQPSQQSVDTWQKEFNYNLLPMKAISFGVNTEKFKPKSQSQLLDNSNYPNNNIKHNIFLYYKKRKSEEYNFLINFLKNRGYRPKVFNYVQRYDETEYL